MNLSSAILFRMLSKSENVNPNLIFGNTDMEWFDDMYKLAALSELDREAEVAICHADLTAHQDMDEIHEQQRQVDNMRAAVAEQTKRRQK
jgi:hypothetical protein